MTATNIIGDAREALTVRETAAKLGVSIRQVMALINEGKLPGTYKFGLIRLIPKHAIEDRIRRVQEWKVSHGRK